MSLFNKDDNTIGDIFNQLRNLKGQVPLPGVNDFDPEESAKVSETAYRTQKVAQLIILLIKIEKELQTVQTTLIKLGGTARVANNTNMQIQINDKLIKIKDLLQKIRQARLNLNFHFI